MNEPLSMYIFRLRPAGGLAGTVPGATLREPRFTNCR